MFVIETVGAGEAEIPSGKVRAAFEGYRGGLVPPSGALADTAEVIRARLGEGWAAVAREEGAAGRSVAGCILCQRRDDSVHLGRLSHPGFDEATFCVMEKPLR